jgi:4-oxalocrotonate tautomerase
MPYLNLKLSTSPSAALRAQAVAVLTDLTATILGKKRELTAIVVEHLAPASWSIGARTLAELGQASFYLDIKITEGTNTKAEKARYVAEVFRALEGLFGPVHPASYVVIEDVRADSWGYQGATQEFRAIRGQLA